jgi:hypothetical protein
MHRGIDLEACLEVPPEDWEALDGPGRVLPPPAPPLDRSSLHEPPLEPARARRNPPRPPSRGGRKGFAAIAVGHPRSPGHLLEVCGRPPWRNRAKAAPPFRPSPRARDSGRHFRSAVCGRTLVNRARNRRNQRSRPGGPFGADTTDCDKVVAPQSPRRGPPAGIPGKLLTLPEGSRCERARGVDKGRRERRHDESGDPGPVWSSGGAPASGGREARAYGRPRPRPGPSGLRQRTGPPPPARRASLLPAVFGPARPEDANPRCGPGGYRPGGREERHAVQTW